MSSFLVNVRSLGSVLTNYLAIYVFIFQEDGIVKGYDRNNNPACYVRKPNMDILNEETNSEPKKNSVPQKKVRNSVISSLYSILRLRSS